jgi:AcrR family transcriptional regulator
LRAVVSKGRLAERSDATRAALVAAAREVFAELGFSETTVDHVVQRAGVTRGALYHHFASKEELFGAVYEVVEKELAERSMVEALRGRTPMSRLQRGIDAFLDACLEPAVQRIVLLDALSVLGWESWHEIGVRYNFGLMVIGLQGAVDDGAIPRRPVEPLAHLVQGAVMRAGMVIARADDPAAARKAVGAELRALLAGLRSRP